MECKNLDQVKYVDKAISSRHAVRAFLDTPIPNDIIKDILKISSRAPSGTNTQPWKIYVVTGKKRHDIIQEVCAIQTSIFSQPALSEKYIETFSYYPKVWTSPYLTRRKQNGADLYELLNIKKNDKEKMQRQLLRNFKLFDAPVGLFFTVDKALGIGSKMDISMMIQNIMIAAKARGLDTCPQAAWNKFNTIVLQHLNASNNEELLCTIALGYADSTNIINSFQTPRLAVEEFTTFLD